MNRSLKSVGHRHCRQALKFVIFILVGCHNTMASAQSQESVFSAHPNLQRVFFNDFENLSGGEIVEGNFPSKMAPAAALGRLAIQYQGGTADERAAEVVGDPTRGGNAVLRFRVNQPNVRNAVGKADKARIQLNAYAARCLKEEAHSVRIYLPASMGLLRNIPGRFSWMTIAEWWNNNDWSMETNSFRITVNIGKFDSASGTQLSFNVKAQAKNPGESDWNVDVWTATNTSFAVPSGKWMTLEYYFKEGDQSMGKFAMNAKVDGEPNIKIFDVTNFTHGPTDQRPNGLTQFNPLKLYTSDTILKELKKTGGELSLLWDDLEIRTDSSTAFCR